MKAKSPFPITEDSFSQCWDYVDKCRRAARRQAVTAKTGGFLVTLFFFVFLIFLGCGLLYAHTDGSFREFWKILPVFPLWQKISGFLLAGDGEITGQIIKAALLGYAVSAVVFALLAGLLLLIYHPRKAELPTGSYAEKTALLAKKAQEAKNHSYETHINSSVVATVISVFVLVMVFFAYMFYVEDAAKMMSYLSVFPFKDVSTNCLLYVLFLYWLCGITGDLLIFLTRPLYRYNFPNDLVVQAQREAFLSEEGSQEFISNLAAFREEALALERSGAYNMAMDMLKKAAVCGDGPAMEHYARHCLIKHMNRSARYWLDQRMASGEASREAKKMHLRMKLRLRHNTEYLKPEEAPPTTGKKIIRTIGAVIGFIWKMLMLLIFIVILLGMLIFFTSNTHPEILDKLPDEVAQIITELKTYGGSANSSTVVQEEIPYEVPVLSLSIEGTKWEGNPAVISDRDEPVIFCYSKELGGDLLIPYHLDGRKNIDSAHVFTGSESSVRSIKKHVSALPETNTLVISEEYLLSRDPGEYYIILDQWSYVPLIISETAVNTSQRGLAAMGNDVGWIVFDLAEPADITLPFYNLGEHRISSVSQLQQIVMTPKPTETPLDQLDYTISPDGHSVTIHADYLSQQQVGFSMGFRVYLENGEVVDTGHTYIGIAEDGFTGLMEITGEEAYSLSKDQDYTASYTFGITGAPMFMYVQVDGQDPFIEDDLSDLLSDYIDLDEGTITIPESILKEHLEKGDWFRIGISYVTGHGHPAYASFPVEVRK